MSTPGLDDAAEDNDNWLTLRALGALSAEQSQHGQICNILTPVDTLTAGDYRYILVGKGRFGNMNI